MTSKKLTVDTFKYRGSFSGLRRYNFNLKTRVAAHYHELLKSRAQPKTQPIIKGVKPLNAMANSQFSRLSLIFFYDGIGFTSLEFEK